MSFGDHIIWCSGTKHPYKSTVIKLGIFLWNLKLIFSALTELIEAIR